MRNKVDRNLNVECDHNHQFANLKDILVYQADIYILRGLEDERHKSKGYPTLLNALI